MAGSNADIFIPGGRRFTVITPFSPPGRPTTVLIPVVEMGQSASDLSHLVKKRRRSLSTSPELRSVRAKSTVHSTPEFTQDNTNAEASIDTLFPLIDVKRAGEGMKAKLEEISSVTPQQPLGPRLIHGATTPTTSATDSEVNVEHAKSGLQTRRRALRRSGLFSANPGGPLAKIKLQSRKLYNNDVDMHWYILRGELPIDAPPALYPVAALRDGSLFVYHFYGGGCQMWIKSGDDDDAVWDPILEGETWVFGGDKYFLVINRDSGNPSWVNKATYEKRSRAARRQGKKREVGL